MTAQTIMSGHFPQTLQRARSHAAAMIFGSLRGCPAISGNVSGVRRFNSRSTPFRQSPACTAQTRQKAVGRVVMVVTPRPDAPVKPFKINGLIRENVHACHRYNAVTNTARVCLGRRVPTVRGQSKRADFARVSRRMSVVIAGFSRSFLFRRASP